MTHKQIWTEISEAFYTPESEGTGKQRKLSRSGLCLATLFLDWEHWLAFSDLCECCFRAGFWLPSTRRSHCSDWHKREHDLLRGDFAALMACMTEKEFNQLLAPKVPTNGIT